MNDDNNKKIYVAFFISKFPKSDGLFITYVYSVGQKALNAPKLVVFFFFIPSCAISSGRNHWCNMRNIQNAITYTADC